MVVSATRIFHTIFLESIMNYQRMKTLKNVVPVVLEDFFLHDLPMNSIKKVNFAF